jgi:hypothetical protein
VSHREFENALVDNGMTLAGLMGRLVSDLRWRVLLEGPGSDLPCVGAVGQLGNCYVIEPSDPLPASTAHAKNLQVLVPIYSSGKPVGTIELKGSITAGRAGSISTVQTEAHGNVADGQGGTIPLNQTFSRKTLAPQGVQPGQIVQISVVFSFS